MVDNIFQRSRYTVYFVIETSIKNKEIQVNLIHVDIAFHFESLSANKKRGLK